MSETQNVKVKNLSSVSWAIWYVGFLFTCGLIDPQSFGEFVAIFIFWPILVGDWVKMVVQ